MTVTDDNRIPQVIAARDDILARVADKVGQYLEGRIIDKMDEQHGGWPALAPTTVMRKGSTKAWIDTGELREQITYHVRDGLPRTVAIGIFEHDKALVARWLEFGTRYIPERPLFRLVFDLEDEHLMNLIRDEIGTDLDRLTF